MARQNRRKQGPPHPAQVRGALEAGVLRVIPRHELIPGSWQLEEYDKGRTFYGPPKTSDTIPKPLNVHEHAEQLAKIGSLLMVFMQAENRSIPYEQYAATLETPETEERPQLEAVADTAGSISVAEAAA